MSALRSTQRTFYSAILAGLLLLAVSAWGQSFNANITGGGGTGKCTFEVRVDGVANVQIRGNQGFLQTKSGMPAQCVRLKCNQPLPRNPINFRFQGVDGRGRQYMLKDPASNNGVAVIRIEDNRNGMEGYTGDIFWSGGNNNGGNNGNNGQWNNNLVPNCQNNIRNEVRSQTGGASVSFNGNPSRKQAASFVMVDGNGNARGNNGRQGNFSYHCTMNQIGRAHV